MTMIEVTAIPTEGGDWIMECSVCGPLGLATDRRAAPDHLRAHGITTG
jgi:hypothetical protein